MSDIPTICPKCEGEGTVKGSRCPTCHGTGFYFPKEKVKK
jgi:DnaJ-class molecular chaperone